MFEIVVHKKFAKKLKEIEKPFLVKIANFIENLNRVFQNGQNFV